VKIVDKHDPFITLGVIIVPKNLDVTTEIADRLFFLNLDVAMFCCNS